MQNIQFNQSLVGQILEDDYVIQEFLGAGGMGATFKAKQSSLGRQVCIKFLALSALTTTESVSRFRREARILAKLRHKNIVECFSFGLLDGVYPFLVMEMVEGRSLRELLRQGPLDWRHALHIVRQVAIAMQEAHQSDIIHRDLKPDNIMLQGEFGKESVKVIDFGLAGKLSAELFDTLTTPGTLIGTANYMPPEVFCGGKPGAGGDVYAIGCTLYECLTGELPFCADNPVAVIRMKTVECLPDLPQAIPASVRRQLVTVIQSATNKEPQLRTVDCLSLDSALLQIEQDHTNEDVTHKNATVTHPLWLVRLLISAMVLSLIAAGLFIAYPGRGVSNTRFGNEAGSSFQGLTPQRSPLLEGNALQESDKTRMSGLITSARSLLKSTQPLLAVVEFKTNLDSFLRTRGYLFELSGQGEFRKLQQQLCQSVGDVLQLASLSANGRLVGELRGQYADLLLCCGYYREAEQVMFAKKVVRSELGPGNEEAEFQPFVERLIDLIKDEPKKEFLVLRLRTLAPRMSADNFIYLALIMRERELEDEWEPSLSQLAVKLPPVGKSREIDLLCDLAELEFRSNRRSECRKLLKRAVSLGAIPAVHLVFVADAFFRMSDSKTAVDLLAEAAARAERRNESCKWCMLKAVQCRLLVSDKQFDASESVLKEIRSSRNWKQISQWRFYSSSAQIDACKAVQRLEEALLGQSAYLDTHQRKTEAVEKMHDAAELLLNTPWAEGLSQFLNYLGQAAEMGLYDVTSRDVAAAAVSAVETGSLYEPGSAAIFCFDYCNRLWHAGEKTKTEQAMQKGLMHAHRYIVELAAGEQRNNNAFEGIVRRLTEVRKFCSDSRLQSTQEELLRISRAL